MVQDNPNKLEQRYRNRLALLQQIDILGYLYVAVCLGYTRYRP